MATLAYTNSRYRKEREEFMHFPRKKKRSLTANRSFDMYLLLIPGLIFILIFNYLPMYGTVIAFKDYNIFAGSNPIEAIFNSEWVGLKYWEQLWIAPEFRQALRNTLVISILKIVVGFPVPILLALFINEIRSTAYKRTIQTVLYLPHFMSWAVVGALFLSILGTTGAVNSILNALGMQSVKFFMDEKVFPGVLLTSALWKESGWNTIVYLAAITGVSPELYEAATVDGATRLQKMRFVTLPCIASTVMMMLILRLGSLMAAGFDQVLVMYNPTVFSTGDIIDTYVYRIGLGQLNFSLGTAVGLFNSIISFVLVMSSNLFCRKAFGRSIW